MRTFLSVLAALCIILLTRAPLLAQSRPYSSNNQHKLIDKDSVKTLLPETIGNYKRTQLIEAPSFSDSHGPTSITYTGVYYMKLFKTGFMVNISTYRSSVQRHNISTANWKRKVDLGSMEKTSIKNHPTFVQKKPPLIGILIGDNFEFMAYNTQGGLTLNDLYTIIDAFNFKPIETLSGKNTTPKKALAQAPSKDHDLISTKWDTARTVPDEWHDNFDCASFNADVKKKTKKMVNAKFVPWIHFLKSTQTATAKISKQTMRIPKKGNSWLQCVQKNDLLWAPLIPANPFLRRVVAFRNEADAIVFLTKRAGLVDAIAQGQTHIDSNHSHH